MHNAELVSINGGLKFTGCMLVCSGGGDTTTTYYHMHVSASKETVSTPQARTTVKMQPCLVMVSVATLSCHLYRTKCSLLAHPSRTKPFCALQYGDSTIIGGARQASKSGPEPGRLQLQLAM